MLDNLKIPGEAVDKAAAAVIEQAGKELVGGTSNFASNVFNGLLGDRVREWRNRNLIDMAAKTAEKLKAAGVSLDAARALPMLELYSIFDGASQQDDPEVQDLWAGLLASRMLPDQDRDFDQQAAQILAGMNGTEARVLNFIATAHAIGVEINARMPAHDFKRAKSDPNAYSLELAEIRKPLLAERVMRITQAHAESFDGVPESRISGAVGALDLKGLIYPFEDIGFRIKQGEDRRDGYRVQRVESLSPDKVVAELQEMRRRSLKELDRPDSIMTRLFLTQFNNIQLTYGFTGLGRRLMQSCSKRAE